MTNEIKHNIGSWARWVEWARWAALIAGVMMGLCGYFAPINPDLNLEIMGRTNLFMMAVSMILLSWVLKNSDSIHRIDDRVEKLERDSEDPKE